MSTSSIRQPAVLARSTISSGQPKRRSAMPSARRSVRCAARIGPRCAAVRPCAAATRTPAPGWPGGRCERGRRGEVGRRAPRTRSASPASTGPATRSSCRGSIEASASMKQTTSERAAVRPAKQAAPRAALRLVDDGRAVGERHRGGSVRRAVVDHDRAHPAGMRPSTHGSASASSSTRKDHVHHASHRRRDGRAER